jgi:chromosome segregation ATPase
MSFVGKLLVIAQVVLSILFMAVAGAVFATHTNWKKKYDDSQTALKKMSDENQQVRDDAEKAKGSLTTQVNDEHNLRLMAETSLAQSQTTLAALAKDKNDLQAQIQTQTGIAETKSNEAGYRDEEARQQRQITADLQNRLDESSNKVRELEDQIFTMTSTLTALQQEHDELLKENSDQRRQLAAAGKGKVDSRSVTRLQEPPPPVDGLVKEVSKDKTGRPKLMVITIGSDDGLLKGHELDAFRSGVDGRKAQYLGRVKVISLTPDEAVCEVVDAAKNGIIEVGDNVTTKL